MNPTFQQIEDAIRNSPALEDPSDPRDLPVGEFLGDRVELPTTFSLRPQMTPVRNQVGRGTCHSDDTEVLTDNGWKLFEKLTDEDLLGTVNPNTFFLEFQKPSERQKISYKGELYTVRGASLDFSVTPDHRMFVRKFNQKKRTLEEDYQFVETKEIGWYTGLLPTTQGFNGTRIKKMFGIEGDDFMRFLGIFIADGWIYQRRDSQYGYKIGCCCFDERYYEEIYELLISIGFREQPARKGYFYFSCGKEMYDYLYHFAGQKALKKFVPDSIKNASQYQINLFLDWFAMGDGGVNKGQHRYYTSSPRLAGDLQELLLKIGKRSSISIRDRKNYFSIINGRKIKQTAPSYTIGLWRKNTLSIIAKKQIEIEEYDGFVYCATVPNSILVTRRNGKILISGNCNAHACLAVAEFFNAQEYKNPSLNLSEEYLYKRIKDIDVLDYNFDGYGSFARSGMKALQKYGACEEVTLPYQGQGKEDSWKTLELTEDMDKEALKYKSDGYVAIPITVELCKRTLFEKNAPFVMGFKLYENYREGYETGVIPFKDGQKVGGHFIAVTGWNETHFECKNSWGSWGDQGYIWLPFTMIDLYFSAWSIIDRVDRDEIRRVLRTRRIIRDRKRRQRAKKTGHTLSTP